MIAICYNYVDCDPENIANSRSYLFFINRWQEYIEEILHKRLIEQIREELAREAHEALHEYYSGSCKEGSINDLWKDLVDSNSLEWTIYNVISEMVTKTSWFKGIYLTKWSLSCRGFFMSVFLSFLEIWGPVWGSKWWFRKKISVVGCMIHG